MTLWPRGPQFPCIAFLMVNIALVRMRKTHPTLKRPFRVAFVPWLQYLSIAVQLVLAIEWAQLSPVAWVATIVWLLLGVWVYRSWLTVEKITCLLRK